MIKFLVDAQLPRRLAQMLAAEGFNAMHTLDLPLRNATPDSAVNEISITEKRVVISKDADFVDSYILHGKPWKLLLISTGNIVNSELITLVKENIQKINLEFTAGASFIEINRTSLIIHV